MFKSFFANRKWAVWAYGGLVFILVSLCVQVQLTVQLNGWYGAFFDLLQQAEQHTMDEFWLSMQQLSYIALPYVIIATIISYVTRLYSFKWREAMTFAYIVKWRVTDNEIEGSSQRIQEDIYRFARIFETLGLQVIKAILTLLSFSPILWALSNDVAIPLVKDIQGSLVWIALLVSLAGLVFSWLVGIKLPELEYNNQKVEAAFRKELVYAEDDKTNFGKTPTLVNLFNNLKLNYNKLFIHYGYFALWANSFEQIMIITPYLIMVPGLFSGMISLGILVQVANAFSKVRESFSIFISNWTTITELRSIHKRLREFEQNINF